MMVEEKTFEKQQVIEIVETVIKMVSEKQYDHQRPLRVEINRLHKTINDLMSELSSLHPGSIVSKHVPSATDELDAVVALTESATNEILTASESLLEQLEKAGIASEAKHDLEHLTSKIIEACTFQDLTGQRVAKIISALKTIDKKSLEVLKMLESRLAYFAAFDEDGAQAEKVKQEEQQEESLMNGPQLPGGGLSQEEIDALLSQFD
ncbi:MAG: protein phosphatase CheZ [Alphaproteobacteria bacterium]